MNQPLSGQQRLKPSTDPNPHLTPALSPPSKGAEREFRPPEGLVPNPKLKFMEQCREVMRFKRLALRTEEAYLQWIKRFMVFHRGHGSTESRPTEGWRHPQEMGV